MKNEGCGIFGCFRDLQSLLLQLPQPYKCQIHANTFLAEEEAERWAQRVAEHAEVNQFCSNQVYGADRDWRRKLLQLQEL